jgi:hypothetical protein
MNETKQATSNAGPCGACDKHSRKVYVIRAYGTEHKLCKGCLKEMHKLCLVVKRAVA